ncbi:MAG: redoxin domain-containing protein [Chitinophagaceae bacterium]
MKPFVVAIALCFVSSFSFSQSDSIPLYKQNPIIPSFKLMRADSSFFQLQDIVKKKHATVVIIFSPTCSHCQHQAEEITSHMKDFENVNFIFSTLYPVQDMKTYINDYGLDKFPNITVGHDKGYNLGTFYQISSLPGIFVYDKKGKLVANFESNVKSETLLEALAK